MNLNQYSIAAAQPGLAVEHILNLGAPVPLQNEQARIAAHIQTETAGSELALSQIEKQVLALKEYRTRLIADVVTGKLDVRGVELPEIEEELTEPAVLGEAEGYVGADAEGAEEELIGETLDADE